LDGALLKVLLDASGSPLRNGTKCAIFCYYGDITGAACSWAALSVAALMGQRLANGLPATRAPGFSNTYIMHIYPRHLNTELCDIFRKMKLGVGDEVAMLEWPISGWVLREGVAREGVARLFHSWMVRRSAVCSPWSGAERRPTYG